MKNVDTGQFVKPPDYVQYGHFLNSSSLQYLCMATTVQGKIMVVVKSIKPELAKKNKQLVMVWKILQLWFKQRPNVK